MVEGVGGGRSCVMAGSCRLSGWQLGNKDVGRMRWSGVGPEVIPSVSIKDAGVAQVHLFLFFWPPVVVCLDSFSALYCVLNLSVHFVSLTYQPVLLSAQISVF